MIHNEIEREVGNNDFSDSVKTYYHELRNYSPIPREKERELMVKAKHGDIGARNKILSANLRFVFNIAKKYRGHGVDISDLISEGNKGMIKAMDKFDLSQDVKFFSYAVWWIRQHMMMAIQKKMEKDAVEKSFDDIFGSYDNDDECSIENISSEKDMEMNDNDPSEDNGYGIIDKEEETQKHFVVEKLLASLDDRERLIITKYFGIENDDEGHGIDEISKELNLTTERIRQLKVKAINQLRAQVFNIKEAQFLF